MKSDIQIAQEAKMIHIREVAQTVGIEEEDLEFYGKYKAKLSDDIWEKVKDKPDGKLVLVTAINPTPAGEGKTTTTVGLGQAMAKLNKKAIIDHLPMQPGDVDKTICDWSKAKALLNYIPKTSFVEGISKFINWLNNTKKI